MDWMEFVAKTVDEALTEALIKLETTSDKLEWEVIEKESNGILGLFSKPAKIRVKKWDLSEVARHFLEKIFKSMSMKAEIEIVYDEMNDKMDITVNGDDMGILIGKRGQTLDSLQYLVSLVVNKKSSTYVKVKLDTENYRERRKETLENLAKNISIKVKKTRRSVALEPMNPYERRIIHSALQYDKAVETYSEGEEPYRKVVVALKKDNKEYSKNQNYKGYHKGYKKNNYNKNSSGEGYKKKNEE